MLEPSKVIKAINESLGLFFLKGEGGLFYLVNHKSLSTFRLRVSDDCSNAYDDYGNGGDYVKVVKWFNDYWLFIEIRFNQSKGLLITLSVFQGEETDEFKNQLFRAEWDDYGDNMMNHPQPHWHFLADKSVERTVSCFADIASPEVQGTFEEVLSEEKNKIVDLSKFHFAMNGDWNNTSSHIHSISDVKILANWFKGLLAYLKNELKYIDEKRSK